MFLEKKAPKGSLNPSSKLTEDQRKYIRSSTKTCRELAKEFGVHHTQISRARRNK